MSSKYTSYVRRARRYTNCYTKTERVQSVAVRAVGVLLGSFVSYIALITAFTGEKGWLGSAGDAAVLSIGVWSATLISGDWNARAMKKAVSFAKKVTKDLQDGSHCQAEARALAALMCAGVKGKVMFWQIIENTPAGMREDPEMREFLEKLSGWRKPGVVMTKQEVMAVTRDSYELFHSPRWRRALQIQSILEFDDAKNLIKGARDLSFLPERGLDLAEEIAGGWREGSVELAKAVEFLAGC